MTSQEERNLSSTTSFPVSTSSSAAQASSEAEARALEAYVSQLREEVVPEAIIYVFCWVIGTAGNLFILHQLSSRAARSSRARPQARMNLLIRHLAIADLIVIWFTITIEIVWRLTVTWNTSQLGCKVGQVMRTYGLYLTSMIMICISLDRFYAFVYPMSVFDSSKRNRRLLFLSYGVSLAASVPNVSPPDILLPSLV